MMKTQTSLVAEQVRLQHWTKQIKTCQTRPNGMNVDTWSDQHGITKSNYYYRLRRVRETCLCVTTCNKTNFVELPVSQIESVPDSSTIATTTSEKVEIAAVLHDPNDLLIEIKSNASSDFIHSLIGALSYAQ